MSWGDVFLVAAHRAAVEAAGLDPFRVLTDVAVDQEGSCLLVSELVVDDAGRAQYTNGRAVVIERTVPLPESHPWWHDTASVLPRFSD